MIAAVRRARRVFALVWIALLLGGGMAAGATAQGDDPADPGPAPDAIGEPIAPMSEKRVYDMANLLNNEQEALIELDAARLTRHGMPVIVLVQASTMSPVDADAFATDVRHGWGVETRAGADDGLVLLVTVDPTAGGQAVFTTVSWGANALPHFGITSERADEVQEHWLTRYVQDGRLAEGIVYTLRQFIYHSIYDPAPQRPITGFQASLGSALSLIGPLLAIVATVAAGQRWTHRGGLQVAPAASAIAVMWAIPCVGVALAGLAIWAHSGWGVSAALMMLAIAVADWVLRDPRRRAANTPGAPAWKQVAP